MSAGRRSSHDVKCCVFKNNYTKLREGFKSTGFSIKGFLYSKDVINAETRDTQDMDKVLADVEVKLKFAETTWETLLCGMCEPPLDALCCDLKREFETELLIRTTEYHLFTPPHPPHIPTSLNIPEEHTHTKTSTNSTSGNDSGCGSTSNQDNRNYPDSYFPPAPPPPSSIDNSPHINSSVSPVNPSVSSINPSVSPVNPSVSPVNPSVSPVNPSVHSVSSITLPLTDSSISHFDVSSTTDLTDFSVSSDTYESSPPLLNSDDKCAQRNFSDDSGYGNSLTKYQTSTVCPVPVSHLGNCVSELVNPLMTKATEIEQVDGSNTELSLHKKITTLEVENNNLRLTKKHIVDQIKDLEGENSYLMDIRKEDQQLLEFKMRQVAQENELLERKQEFIRRLENENRKVKKDLKTCLTQQELLMKRNEELMCSIQLAERSTSLSAITIDHLKQEVTSRNNVIDELREELSHYREWYRTFIESSHKNNTTSDEPNDSFDVRNR